MCVCAYVMCVCARAYTMCVCVCVRAGASSVDTELSPPPNLQASDSCVDFSVRSKCTCNILQVINEMFCCFLLLLFVCCFQNWFSGIIVL